MNRLGFLLGGAAVGALIGFALAALSALGLDVLGEVTGFALRRHVENLLPYPFGDQYGYALVVAFFSALGGILVAESGH